MSTDQQRNFIGKNISRLVIGYIKVSNRLSGLATRRDLFKKVEIYSPDKFRCDISIHGGDKTTSGFGKGTAAILEFYFRFRF